MDSQRLSDRAEIADLLTAYTRAVDTKQYADAERLFTDDAELDYSSPGGPVTTPSEALAWVGEMMSAFDRWQHTLGQLSYDFVSEDEAKVTAYFVNPMILKDDSGEKMVEVGGYYHHELVRTPDGWRSRRMVDELVWNRGF